MEKSHWGINLGGFEKGGPSFWSEEILQVFGDGRRESGTEIMLRQMCSLRSRERERLLRFEASAGPL